MAKEMKLGIALLPRKPTILEINTYVDALAKDFPQAKVLIAMSERPNEDVGILHKNPHVSILHMTKEPLDIVAGGYCLMAAARAIEIEWLFINTGMKRYLAPTFSNFIKGSSQYARFLHFVFGVPPIFRPQTAAPDDISAMTHDAPRHRLLVDMFLNYAFSTAQDSDFTNWNAGMCGLRIDAIKYLLSAADYDDSSLLCPQMLWYLKQDKERFTTKAVPVDKLELDGLGFNPAKAAREIAFVLSKREKIGRGIGLRPLAINFFSERVHWNRWVMTKDQDWFFQNIVPAVEKLIKK